MKSQDNLLGYFSPVLHLSCLCCTRECYGSCGLATLSSAAQLVTSCFILHPFHSIQRCICGEHCTLQGPSGDGTAWPQFIEAAGITLSSQPASLLQALNQGILKVNQYWSLVLELAHFCQVLMQCCYQLSRWECEVDVDGADHLKGWHFVFVHEKCVSV